MMKGTGEIYNEKLDMMIPLDVKMYVLNEDANWSDKEKLALGKVICTLYSRDMHTIDSICKYFGLSYSIWNHWVNTVPKLKKKYTKAKERASKVRQGTLKNKALRGLEKLLDGHRTKIVTKKRRVTPLSSDFLTLDQLKELDLNPLQEHELNKIEFEEITEKELYFPPNIKAIEITLTNLNKEDFARNPDPSDIAGGETNIPLIDFVQPKLTEDVKKEEKEVGSEEESQE